MCFIYQSQAQNIVWDRTIGGESGDFLYSLKQTKDGGHILGGSSASLVSGDKTAKNHDNIDCVLGPCHYESDDFWVVKTDATGKKLWDKTYGGTSSDYITTLNLTADGGYILGGYSASDSSGIKTEPNKGHPNEWGDPTGDYWIVKINAAGEIEWDKTIGGNDDDFLKSIQQTQDGGYILGGESYSQKGMDKSENNKTNTFQRDYWVVKLNAQGEKVWDKTIGGESYENFASLQQTKDGGYILGGSSGSGVSGNKTEPNKGKDLDWGSPTSDFWIVKLNASGSIVWDKTIGGSNGDGLSSLQQTSDGGYILAGVSNSSIGGDKTENSKGSSDYWIVKIDASGKKIWDKTYGGSNGDNLSFFAITSDGGYLLGGDSYSNMSGDKSENNIGGSFSADYWVIKLDAQANRVWDNTIGGEGDDRLKSLLQTRNGEYILGGFSYSKKSGDKSEDNKDSPYIESVLASDFWIVKVADKQNPETTAWDMRYGGSATDNLTSVIKTQDGGYLAGGYSASSSSGDKTQNSQGQNDYWIVKSDQNGKKLWDKRYGGSANDYLNRLIQTQDGGYLLAGSSFSGKSGNKSEASKGNRDYWIIKIDKQGNHQWDKTFGSSGYDELKKVIQLPNGEFVLGGSSNSPTNGDKTQASQGSTDYWIVKISKNGTKIWDKRYGGSLNETLSSFVQTQDGGFLLGGTSFSGKTGDKTQVSQGASDYWVVKTDKDGRLVWEKTFGGSGSEEAYSIGTSVNSNYFIAGTSSSGKSGDKTQASKGGKDYWLVTLDQNGNKVWDKTFGGSQDDELRASTFTSQGHYVLAGSSYSGESGDKTQSSQGKSDYWIVEADVNGNKVQDQRYGGNGTEELRTITQTRDGGLLLGGRSDSNISGDRTQPTQGSTDYWLVKVAPVTNAIVAARTTTLSEQATATVGLTPFMAYPNPFQDKVTVRFTLPETQAVTLKVLDSQGNEIKTLFQQEAQANQTYQIEWQAAKQVSGMYLLQLQTPTSLKTQKLILSK